MASRLKEADVQAGSTSPSRTQSPTCTRRDCFVTAFLAMTLIRGMSLRERLMSLRDLLHWPVEAIPVRPRVDCFVPSLRTPQGKPLRSGQATAFLAMANPPASTQRH